MRLPWTKSSRVKKYLNGKYPKLTGRLDMGFEKEEGVEMTLRFQDSTTG